jgi:hypothetical protein
MSPASGGVACSIVIAVTGATPLIRGAGCWFSALCVMGSTCGHSSTRSFSSLDSVLTTRSTSRLMTSTDPLAHGQCGVVKW